MAPRDKQRSKVYSAEQATFKDTPHSDVIGDGSIEDASDYIDEVLDAKWFRDRWGTKTPVVVPNDRGYWNYTFHDELIQLSPSGRCPWVILHEVAHYLISGEDVEGHGPEFASHYLFLVRKFLGADWGRRLRDYFDIYRVRYKEGADSIPPALAKNNLYG